MRCYWFGQLKGIFKGRCCLDVGVGSILIRFMIGGLLFHFIPTPFYYYFIITFFIDYFFIISTLQYFLLYLEVIGIITD
jgi:hypothetical protein